MNIDRIAISGFDKLKDCGLKLNPMTLFINHNSTASLFSGLEFALDFMKAEPEQKQQMMVQANQDGTFTFEMEGTSNRYGWPIHVKYRFSFEWNGLIVEESLQCTEAESGSRWTYFIKRKGRQAKYKQDADGRCTNPIQIQNNELVLNKFRDPSSGFCSHDLAEELHEMQVITERDLRPETLAQDLYGLKKDSDVWDDLQGAVALLFPGFYKLVVKKEKDSYAVQVIDKTGRTGLMQMPDGFQKMLALVTRLTAADEDAVSLILMEGLNELEEHVDYFWMQELSLTVTGTQAEATLLISSDPPHLAQCINPYDMRLAYPQSNQLTFKPFSSSGIHNLYKRQKQCNKPIGEVTFDLLKEDKETLEPFLKK